MQQKLRKDSEWSVIDGVPCRVIDFNPLALIKDGKVLAINKTTPYASITLECKKFPKNITGYITHKMDFKHLWAAFKERTIKQDEEVIIFWSKKHYKLKLLRFFPGFWPKLWVMICRKNTFEMLTNPNYQSGLGGEAEAMYTLPIIDWKPEVMK